MGMDQRQRRREGSRRAQATRTRRQDARKQRRNRNIFFGIGGAVAAAVVIVLIVLTQGGGPSVGINVSTLNGVHAPPFVYNVDINIDGVPVRVPPTSGNHFPNTSSYGFLGETLVPEAVVHNMEHGASVIWYQPGDPELAAQVNQLVRALGSQCLVAGSFEDMSFRLAVTNWGHVLPLDQFDEAQIRGFVGAYRGDTGPEAGLCRQQS